MKRIRTIPEAAREIKAADPNTYFTEHKLRLLVKRGLLPTVHTGTKVVLLDMDKLEAWLDGQEVT